MNAALTDRPLKTKVHFNRVNMFRKSLNVWTAHNSRGCFQGEKIVMQVPMETVFNPEGRQPRAYFTGKARIRIEGTTLYLVP